jgi:hypothetical protein
MCDSGRIPSTSNDSERPVYRSVTPKIRTFAEYNSEWASPPRQKLSPRRPLPLAGVELIALGRFQGRIGLCCKRSPRRTLFCKVTKVRSRGGSGMLSPDPDGWHTRDLMQCWREEIRGVRSCGLWGFQSKQASNCSKESVRKSSMIGFAPAKCSKSARPL